MVAMVQIRLLGGCTLVVDGSPAVELDSPRLQALLAYLALHRDAPLGRAQVAFQLWPDSTEVQALTNLRGLLHRMRLALPWFDQLVRSERQALIWQPRCAWSLDVAAFQAALEAASAAEAGNDPALARMHFQTAVQAYQGDLLPGLYDDWLLIERERLRDACLTALERVALHAEEMGDHPIAQASLRQLVRMEPLHEPAHRALIRLAAQSGDRAGALRAYHRCVTIFQRELGVMPGATTIQEYERAQGAQADRVPARTVPTIPLVGRKGAVATLQSAWQQTGRDTPRLVLLTGEAGIGKTRLAEELAEWVARQGLAVAMAHCYATTGELAYAPVVAWLRALPLRPLADPWVRELARLMPELLAERADLPPPEPLSEPWQRTRLFQALTHGLLTGRHALLLVLDDLQWCDNDTLDWLQFLLTAPRDHAGGSKLVVVATMRSEDHAFEPRLSTWQARLTRQGVVSSIDLEPLSQEETVALASYVAGAPLEVEAGTWMYQQSEGYPLFIVELVRAGLLPQLSTAQQTVTEAVAATALPPQLRQIVEARLAQLAPTTREVIELAAVIGRSFTYRVLAQASTHDEATLVACLDEAWQRRIIREQDGEAYDFSHARLRDTAYARLSRTRRRMLHRQVAEALCEETGPDADRSAGMIAHHYAAAGHAAEAIDASLREAEAARRIYAYSEALAALERAAALFLELPAHPTTAQRTLQVYETMGEVQLWQARADLARAAFERALQAATGQAPWVQARLERKLGHTWQRDQGGYAQIALHYERAAHLLGPPDAQVDEAWWHEWCQLQLDELTLLYWWGRTVTMEQRLNEVRPLLVAHGTSLQRAALFLNLSQQRNRSNRFAPSLEALTYARTALDALTPEVPPEIRVRYQFGLGFNLLWYGDAAEAEAVLHATLKLAEATGDLAHQARCLAYLVIVYRRQGREAEVEAMIRGGLPLAKSIGMYDYLGAHQAAQAWLHWRHNNHQQAERLARAALKSWHKNPASYPLYWQALWILLDLALNNNRHEEAIAHTRRLCNPDQQIQPAPIEHLLQAALTAWDAAQPTTSHAYLQRAVTLAQHNNVS
ncbi:ATP-binding protein [Candidatus Chloroploca asiatica]|uniref:Bacterial transcriptional activator domain-containing protein n=1 Tax=Candidatus Chloroploca asiatica TaxID=1506545 RepID=A0A2H3KLY1_9CHLR|nr:AAA family ATPase [Candidatus Chloroploca asiatica]PDV99055.1 hypothetical protein A9Q02_13925 [Candidatus Chloroploca asiatica]